MSRVPSPISELPYQKIEKLQRKLTRPEKKFKEFDPQKYEREKLRNTKSPQSEVVQLSKTPADAFTLPREPTGLSKRQVDFAEMEEIRLKGPKSPEKAPSRRSRRLDTRESMVSPAKLRDLQYSPTKSRDTNLSRSKSRFLDSSLSYKSDTILMESPLFRGSSRSNVADHLGKKPWDSPVSQTDERQYKHHVPRQPPKKFYKQKSQVPETNLGVGFLEIYF